MRTESLTSYEAIQVEQIAAWKGRKPGLLTRTIETLRVPLSWLVEKAIPAGEARKLFARMNQAANWEAAHDALERALGIERIEALRDGPLERCDHLVRQVEDLTREVVTGESLLANVGGLATELLEVPEEVLLALRSVHRIAACYGYKLDGPRDQALILAIIGLSLVDEPEERLKAWAQIRFLEDGSLSQEDQELLLGTLGGRLENEVRQDIAADLVGTLIEEKVGEGIPILGAAVGVVLDNAFVHGVEETAQRTFQERWLREKGKVDVIPPAEPSGLTAESISAGLTHAAYSTSYAVSFGVVFPVALVAQAGAAVLPASALDGILEGARTATRDADRLIAGLRGRPDPSPAGSG
jgi:hypothetical protein